MTRASTAVFAFLAVAAVATVLRFTLFGDNKSDPEMIRDALAESIEAGKEGRPGSVVDLLSKNFDVNGYQPGTGEISRLIKEYKPDMTVLDPQPRVSGDQAEIISPVRLSLSFPIKRDFDIQDVKFAFQKEQSTTWLVFPAKKWKLRKVELPDDVAQQIGGATNFGGFGGVSGFGL